MARKARLFVTGGIYHVYCRTARGERVFSADVEAEAFVGTVRLIRDIDRFDVLAWSLMCYAQQTRRFQPSTSELSCRSRGRDP
jgi:hypothetical protein